MIRSRTQLNISSLNKSKQTTLLNSKKYRCDCCKDKKHHDYNRQNRLRRESASSKRLNLTQRPSTRYSSQQNNINIPNTNLICSIQNCQIRAKDFSSQKKLPAILESPHPMEQQKNMDKNSSLKSQQVDMKSYCKNLFSNSKPKRPLNRIEVSLQGEKYFLQFDTSQKMKLAIGELKLLIENSQKQRIKKQQFTK